MPGVSLAASFCAWHVRDIKGTNDVCDLSLQCSKSRLSFFLINFSKWNISASVKPPIIPLSIVSMVSIFVPITNAKCTKY